MGLPDTLVVFLCILGAAATVTVGFAFQRLWGKKDEPANGFKDSSNEQQQYMREVRQRGQIEAFGEARQHRYRVQDG